MMLTFREFLADAAKKGEVVNTLFEERLFDLVGVLHKITDALSSESIPHALIGGLAVLIHVEEANPERARDILHHLAMYLKNRFVTLSFLRRRGRSSGGR
jgi:hypothetical protein